MKYLYILIVLLILAVGCKTEPSISPSFSQDVTVDSQVEEENCFKDGKLKTGYDKYDCCEGLTWIKLNIETSIGGECYRNPAYPVASRSGYCTNCGDGLCNESLSEDTCTCPEDCSDSEYWDYQTAEEFCQKSRLCSDSPYMDSSICDLCK